jgi:hypothetical protein
MKSPQTNRKNGGQGSLFNWRWLALLAVLGCLIMAGRATAGTLTVSSTVITVTNVIQPYGYGLGQSYNLSAEGDLDWAHWGTYLNSDYDHKAGVTPQIGNFSYSALGLGGWSTSDANCNWVDGTVDQVMPGTRGGVFINGPGTMSFDVTSSGVPEVLHVYTAPYANPQEFAAPGATMTFALSDSTPPVTISLEAMSRRSTVAFNAASGTTLTVTMNCPGAGRIGLIAASLSSADPLPLGVSQAQLGSGTGLKVGSTFYVQAIAHGTDINGGSAYAYQWQASFNGGSYADIAGATSWQLQTTAGVAGTYNYRVRVTLGANTVTSAPSATLTATAGTSALGATSAEIPAYTMPLFLATNVDLTAEGATDWAYWGFTAPGSYDSKGSSIGNYTQIGANAMKIVTSRTSFSWTDGTPTASSGGTTTNTAGMISTNGFQLNIPVTTTPQVLNVYVSANFAYAQVEASLANGSAPVFVDKPQTTLGTVRYTFGVAANAGTTLIIKVTNIGRQAIIGNGGSIALQAATLTPVPALSVGALVASPNTSVSVNQPMVVSPGAFNLQGMPPFSYVWLRDTGAGYVTQPNTTRSASFTAGSTAGTESWHVVVTNSQGSVTSAPVVITRIAGGILKRLDNSLIGITDMTQEGTIDWSTWNVSAVGDFYHKASGGSQIGPYILLGPDPSNERGGGTRIPMMWSDGTPVATGTNYWTARRNSNSGPLRGGYELDVAASTTSRILSVYIVSFQAPIHIEAYLDDNSGIKLVDEDIPVPDSGNSGSWKYSLQFAAANPGAHLIFRVWILPTGGNFQLLGATLSGLPALGGGTVVVSPSSTVAVGSTINLQAQGATGIPPLQYQWQLDSGAGYVNIPGATNASQLTTSGTATVGGKNYKVVVTDASGSVASTPVAVSVIAATSTLTGSYSVAISLQNGGRLTNNLTTEGVLDWAHWGFANVASYDVKSPVAGQISTNTFIGPFYDPVNNLIRRGGESSIFSWTDGTPTAAAFGDQSGIARSGNGLGSELTVPASAYEKVFNVYVMPRNVGAHMEAYLSDNSAPVFMDVTLKGPNYWGFRYSFRYSSPNPGAVLHVRFWQDDGYAAGFMSLYSASLAYANKLYIVPAGGGQVKVTWPAGGTLLQAPTVTGSWTTNSATSPYTFTPTGDQKYFRTQTP